MISAVIGSYNRCAALERTVQRLIAQDLPAREYEIIVVLDGSSDGSAEMLRESRPRCRLQVIEQPNGGLAAARNTGLAAARGDLVLFLDDDILSPPSLLREHVAAHQRIENAVIIGALWVSPESPTRLTAEYLRRFSDRFYRELPVDRDLSWPQATFVPANSSAPTALLRAAGGFAGGRESLRFDFELGMRMWKAGVRFRYEPRAEAWHVQQKNAVRLVQSDAVLFARSDVMMARSMPAFRRETVLARAFAGPWWQRAGANLAMQVPVGAYGALRVPLAIAERAADIPEVRAAAVEMMRAACVAAGMRGAREQAGSAVAVREQFAARVPVLLYHHVGPRRPGTFPSLTITPDVFEEQVAWLAAGGYTGIRAEDWRAWVQEGKQLPEKPVILTFDDGYADLALHAFPVLRQYGFGATTFIVTDLIGRGNEWDISRGATALRLLDAGQIAYWHGHGMEFGSHSCTHAELTTLQPAQVEHELRGSAQRLAAITGVQPSALAYPYGRHNDAVREQAERIYSLAFGAEEGLNSLPTPMHELRRTMVQPTDTAFDLRLRVRTGASRLHNARVAVATARHGAMAG